MTQAILDPSERAFIAADGMTPAEHEAARWEAVRPITEETEWGAFMRRRVPKFLGRPVVGSGCRAAYESVSSAAKFNKTHKPNIERSIYTGRLAAGQVWCYATPEILAVLSTVENVFTAIELERQRYENQVSKMRMRIVEGDRLARSARRGISSPTPPVSQMCIPLHHLRGGRKKACA